MNGLGDADEDEDRSISVFYGVISALHHRALPTQKHHSQTIYDL